MNPREEYWELGCLLPEIPDMFASALCAANDEDLKDPTGLVHMALKWLQRGTRCYSPHDSGKGKPDAKKLGKAWRRRENRLLTRLVANSPKESKGDK